MNKLDKNDLAWAVRRLPKKLVEVMKSEEWCNNIFIGGGFIRAIIAQEKINDIDIFVKSPAEAEFLSLKLADEKKDVIKTDNAYTVKGKIPLQIIHRWVFEKPEDVSNSFDFTVCCAVLFINRETKNFDSFCDQRFYVDLSSKRLVYRNPIRNEDAGGSLLRVLKYYQRGYRIPLNSLSDVIARLMSVVHLEEVTGGLQNQGQISHVVCGLLRVVDPDIDPDHESHLPITEEINLQTINPF